MPGKVALVTGASGGLGRYVTQAFLDAGATSDWHVNQYTLAVADCIALISAPRSLPSLPAPLKGLVESN